MIKSWFQPSLFKRLLVVVMLGVVAISALTIFLTISVVYVAGTGVLDKDLKLIASAVARFSALDPRPEVAARVGQIVRELNQASSDPPIGPEQFTFQTWSRDGKLIARSQEQPLLRLLPPGSVGLEHSTRVDGWIVIAQPSDDGSVIGVIGYSDGFLDRLKSQLFVELLVPLTLVSVIFILTSWVAVRFGLRPLKRLARDIEARAADDSNAIQLKPAYAELSPLIQALNQKIGDLLALRSREREFFADAAHALRTPLAAVTAQAHVLVNETDPVRHREALRAFEQGVARASGSLGKLLTLARLDVGAYRPDVRPVALDSLAADTVDEQRARAEAAGRTLTLDIDEAGGEGVHVVQGDAALLREALDNLVDNALKYTRAGGAVRVAVRSAGANVEIEVSDDGPGIPAEQRERAFNRFERLKSSDIEGSGLGLAIVRRVVEMHGGTLELGAARAEVTAPGCRVSLRLPRASD
jgi:signal transduction histidine kinase